MSAHGPSVLGSGPLDVPDLYEEGVVAVLRLPIPVDQLEGLADALTVIYGPGLTVSGPGRFLIVRTPEEK